jgi:aminoglycoside phosphotransferase (APT) family kinase protein
VRATAASGTDFDVARLIDFLDAAGINPHEPVELDRIGGGQSNPTYFVTRGDIRLVLRKPPRQVLIKSAHDVAREYRFLTALAPTSVPVPAPVRFEASTDVIGTPFYLMSRVDGVVHAEAGLADLRVERRRALYLEHARLLATLHSLDPQQIGLGDMARPGSFLLRQIGRWSDVWGDERSADIASVREYLLASRPAHEATALIHGDFKFNNLIVDREGTSIVGVVDWELAAVGDPLLDVAHVWAATWATTPDEYGGIMGLDLTAAGLPGSWEYDDAYQLAGGRAGALTAFYRVLALLRYAGIFHGVRQRALAGTATSTDALEQGKLADVYLDRALANIGS